MHHDLVVHTLHHVAAHRAAHVAQPDESDLHRVLPPATAGPFPAGNEGIGPVAVQDPAPPSGAAPARTTLRRVSEDRPKPPSRGWDTVSPYHRGFQGFAEAYEAFGFAEIHAGALPFLPSRPGLVLDIGAGSGRDAAWFAAKGWEVVAAEPAAAMRQEAARRHPSPSIRWIDDRLPALAAVHLLGLSFDLVWLSGVWMHIPPEGPAARHAQAGDAAEAGRPAGVDPAARPGAGGPADVAGRCERGGAARPRPRPGAAGGDGARRGPAGPARYPLADHHPRPAG
ncbi:methyltransferase domain-containing protein [Dankookia sp. P2]|uniref:class I SAM-dependent methyltransferase n=1 Tax=Dankookia sp. P2 TaxID=3423955 RepID=UPI003D66EC8A